MKQQRTKLAAGAAAAVVSLALATPAPASTSASPADSSSSVPGDPGTLLALSADVTDAALAAAPPSTSPAATATGSVPSTPGDIPADALLAYQRAADILAAVAPRCSLSWTVLAALGKVTSDHGRSVAASRAGSDTEIPLGPMQLSLTTWSVAGVDGDGDGERSVMDLDDAALAAAVYLCASSRSLATAREIEAALDRFPIPTSDIPVVLAYEAMFRAGDFQVPDESEWAASSVLSLQPVVGTGVEVTPLVGLRTSARQAARLRAELDEAVGRQVRTQVRQALTETRRHADFDEPSPAPALVQMFTAALTESPVAVPSTGLTTTATTMAGQALPAVIAPSPSTSPTGTPTTAVFAAPPPSTITAEPATTVPSASADPSPSTTAEPSPSPTAEPPGPGTPTAPSPPASATEQPPTAAVEETATTPPPPPPPPETTAPAEQPAPDAGGGVTEAPSATTTPSPSPSCDTTKAPTDAPSDTPTGDPSPTEGILADLATTLLPEPTATETQPDTAGTSSAPPTDCDPATP